ncbi:MAG: hypothetical protein K8T25_23905 [Planctomycetia bacterium]|nr:hypothetical protein [Planctomycetia bacterium]
MPHRAVGAEAEPAATEPITLDDIRDLRRERTSIKDIMSAIEKRGLGFTVDDVAEKQLRRMSFSSKMVSQLKGKKAAGPDAAPVAGAGGEAPAAGGDPKQPGGAAGPGRIAGIRRQIDAATDEEYKGIAERVKKIVASSGTTVAPRLTKHITLLANPKIAAQFGPNLDRVEKLLADRFPEPIATGVDPRGSNIVLLETRREYEYWMKALYKVHEDAGLKFNSPDALKSMLATNAVFVQGIFSVCLEGRDAESTGRSLAFAAGFQYMGQLTNNHGPDAIRTGFGNVAEAMVYHDPVTTVVSGYGDRGLGGGQARWIDTVRQRFKNHKVESLAQVMAYTTSNMTLDQYADAWSFTEMLASDPRNFAELVTSLGEGTEPAAAIGKIYGVKDEALMKHWTRFVLGR